jgi:serine/threonine protein kinase
MGMSCNLCLLEIILLAFRKVKGPNGEELAIKKMYDSFSNPVKAKRAYREVKLLQLISHENIIRFVDMYTPDPDSRSLKNM